MTLFVCKTCHERDRNVTKCDMGFHDHPRMFYCQCDICGRSETTKHCHGYFALREINNGKKDDEDIIDPIALERRLNFG